MFDALSLRLVNIPSPRLVVNRFSHKQVEEFFHQDEVGRAREVQGEQKQMEGLRRVLTSHSFFSLQSGAFQAFV